MSKKIIITGATGFLGTRLCRELINKDEELYILTRHADKGRERVPGAKDYIEWDYNKPDEWQHHINGKDIIIHLAGANLAAKRWDEEFKKIAWESRIKSADSLVEAISKADKKPSVFISSSAVGFYGDKGDDLLTEKSPPGNDFLSKLCIEWEKAAARSENYGLRRASVRTGVVLSPEEGALEKLLTPFKLFAGGPLGSGEQWFPWIHTDDIIKIYLYTIYNEVEGPVNAVSPNPVTMNEFADTLGKVLNRPSFFKVPEFMLKIVVGEMAETVTASQKVIPQKLLENNFNFRFKDLENALRDLLKK